MLNAWRTETREKLSKMSNRSKIFWELKRTKREKYTQLPQQNWTSTLHSLFPLSEVQMEIINPQVFNVSLPALKVIWRKITTLWASSMTNNLNWRGKVFSQNKENWTLMLLCKKKWKRIRIDSSLTLIKLDKFSFTFYACYWILHFLQKRGY